MTKKWQSLLAGVAVTTTALLAGASPAMAQEPGGGPPDPTQAPTAERVSAEVLPGVVYLQSDVHTYVRNMSTGQVYGPYDFTSTCTGFVINSSGYVATAGHCVNDEDTKQSLAAALAEAYGQAGDDAGAIYADLMANYELEGDVGGSPADRRIAVVRAATGGTGGAPMQAQVVDSQPNSQGDVALLKVDATNMPSLEVAPSDGVNTGTPIMSVGYPAVRDEVVDPSLAPTWKDGTVSSRQNRNGIPFLEITADMGHGMSGGPTVNQQGQVVGVNSMGTGDGSDSFNFVAPSSALLDMMGRNGVRAEPGPVDVAYRSGLQNYYTGHYSDAGEDFGRVLALQPEHKQAAEFKTKAFQAYEQYGDEGVGMLGWILVGGGALLLVAGGVTIVVVVRSRKGAAPAPTAVPHPRYPGQGQGYGYGYGYGTAAPFPLPQGYRTPIPAPRTAEESARHGQAQPFGTAPYGDTMVAPAPAPATATATPPAGFAVPDGQHVAATTSTGFCPNCGTARTAHARFCGGCGASMN